MKIFLSFLQSPHRHPIPSYSFWEYYLKNGIEESGNHWVEEKAADWAFGLVPKTPHAHAQWKTQIWSKTVEYLKKKPVDLFLSYLYPEQIDTTAIREIQEIGIPCVNFFCDNVREFTAAPKEFGVFDLNWVPEYKALKMYRKAGLKHLHLPMPMWIDPKLRTVPDKELDQVSFIGSKDIQRQLFLESFIAQELPFDVSIYGSSWLDSEKPYEVSSASKGVKETIQNQLIFIKKNGTIGWCRKLLQRRRSYPTSIQLDRILKGELSFDDYINITKMSAITLGINRYPSFRFPFSKPDTYSRLRDIEAPMLGACYLTEWTEGIDQLYELGQEVDTYRSADELIEKAKELLKSKTLRTKLRKSGQQKALSSLCIPNTVTQIKGSLGIK